MMARAGASAIFIFTVMTLCIVQVSSLLLKGVSWNVNGVQKLKTSEHDLKFMGSFDVVMLQETFSATRDATLDLHGYIPHHQLGRRHQWGLTSLFRIEAFVGGSLLRLPCPFDWMVISRWRMPTDLGLLFVNVYLPTHTDGFGRSDVNTALSFLHTLRGDFPNDGFILSGDLNVDTWRLTRQRSEGRIIPNSARFVVFSDSFFDLF
jgi:exonuclease III